MLKFQKELRTTTFNDAIALCIELKQIFFSKLRKPQFSATKMNYVVFAENENFAKFTDSGL